MMTRKFSVSSDDGVHHVCARGAPVGPPLPTRAAADRLSALLNRRRRLLIVVQRGEFSTNSFDAYVKTFVDGDDVTAQDALRVWWEGLSADGYTRTTAVTRVFDVTDRERHVLAADDPRRLLTPEVAAGSDDPSAAISFAPADVRSRLRTRSGSTGDLTDEALLTAARCLTARDRPLWELVDDLDERITITAGRIQNASAGDAR